MLLRRKAKLLPLSPISAHFNTGPTEWKCIRLASLVCLTLSHIPFPLMCLVFQSLTLTSPSFFFWVCCFWFIFVSLLFSFPCLQLSLSLTLSVCLCICLSLSSICLSATSLDFLSVMSWGSTRRHNNPSWSNHSTNLVLHLPPLRCSFSSLLKKWVSIKRQTYENGCDPR